MSTRHLSFIVLQVAITFCFASESVAQSQAERGAVVLKKSKHGEFQQYVPRQNPTAFLVIVHGTPEPGDDVVALADKFIRRWTKFADANRVIVVAPVFGDDYGATEKTPPGIGPGGYRGLYGRQIGADQFVEGIVDSYAGQIRGFDGRFFLYGHSAGGQFACRYCVRHPDRIKGAVFSAAGRFSFPDGNAPWPYGMGTTTIRPDPAGSQIKIEPDPTGWSKAALLPITAVVGQKDTDEQPTRAGHKGTTRVEFAKQWVEEMNALAKEAKKTSPIRLVTVPGIGHDSAGLTPKCQEILNRYISQK